MVSANDMKVDVNLAPAEANDITFGDQTLFVGDSVFTGYNQIMSSSSEPITAYLDETFTEMPANAVVHDVSRVVLAFIDHVRFPSKIEDSTAHALNPHYQVDYWYDDRSDDIETQVAANIAGLSNLDAAFAHTG